MHPAVYYTYTYTYTSVYIVRKYDVRRTAFTRPGAPVPGAAATTTTATVVVSSFFSAWSFPPFPYNNATYLPIPTYLPPYPVVREIHFSPAPEHRACVAPQVQNIITNLWRGRTKFIHPELTRVHTCANACARAKLVSGCAFACVGIIVSFYSFFNVYCNFSLHFITNT